MSRNPLLLRSAKIHRISCLLRRASGSAPALFKFWVFFKVKQGSPNRFEGFCVMNAAEGLFQCPGSTEFYRGQRINTFSRLPTCISDVSEVPSLLYRIFNLQMNYNLLSTLKHFFGHFYEHVEKAGHILSHQLKSQTNKDPPQVNSIPSVINETLKTFYSEPYTSQSLPGDTHDRIT